MKSFIETHPKLAPYAVGNSGFTALVTGATGSGKTLALRGLIEYLGKDEVLIVATDPRLAPLEGTGAKVFEAWVEPGVQGADLKQAATEAWNKLQGFFRDLSTAAKDKDTKMPKVVVLDSLSNLGDILGYSLAPPGGQLTMAQWGEMARRALSVVTFFRGLQVDGMLRIINCTSGLEEDDMGRKVPVIYIGLGGKMAPRHVPRYVDFQFHIEATHAPSHSWAGEDGMMRKWHTCEHDGIIAKGHPKLPTPFMKADWKEVYRIVYAKEA